METKKTAMAFLLLLFIVSVSFEVPVSADASDCLDACETACVTPNNPRLQARCERKCQIRCGPDSGAENSGGK